MLLKFLRPIQRQRRPISLLRARLLSSQPSLAERFYLEVSVQPCDAPDPSEHFARLEQPPSSVTASTIPTPPPPNWYTVALDGRPLKTPAGRRLVVPSEPLAYAIAAEWNAVEHRIQPTSMPLMVTACTTLDHAAGIQIDECMRFFQTDTTLYWADPTADRGLYRAQQEAWSWLHQPWLDTTFFEGKYPVAQVFGTAESMIFLKHHSSTSTGGLPHAPAQVDRCRSWLTGLDPWHATIAQMVMRETKSFLLGAALVTRVCTAEQAQTACRVEEEFQISSWGLVEGQHDYDRLNTSIQLHAAEFATDCLHLVMEENHSSR